MARGHGVIKNAPTIVSPPPFSITGFSPGLLVVLQEILYQSLFCFDLPDYCKKRCLFKVKHIFFSTYCCSVLILLFCVYVFLRALFHSSCLHIYAQLPIRPLIKCCGITKGFMTETATRGVHGHGLKITSCCRFSLSQETRFEVHTTSIILSYICHSGNVNK